MRLIAVTFCVLFLSSAAIADHTVCGTVIEVKSSVSDRSMIVASVSDEESRLGKVVQTNRPSEIAVILRALNDPKLRICFLEMDQERGSFVKPANFKSYSLGQLKEK